MKLRETLFGVFLGVGIGAAAVAVAAPAANWLNEAVTVRLPQSQLVRHPIDNGKYYLCWTDGVSRYGLAFRRTQLDNKIRSIPRAGRVSIASLMASGPVDAAVLSPWTTADAKICWPK